MLQNRVVEAGMDTLQSDIGSTTLRTDTGARKDAARDNPRLQLRQSGSRRIMQRSLYAFLGLTFAITWGIGALLILFPDRLTELFGAMSTRNPLFVLAVWAPAISALVITASTEGVAGLRRLVRGVVHWRVGLWWYLFVLLWIPVLGVGAAFLGGAPFVPGVDHWYLIIPALLSAALTDPGPLGEEPGWRGYALPRLLAERSALSASVILGLIWGVWHIPAFLIGGTPQSGLSLPALLLGGVSLSILATWIYNNSGGSVLLSILLHLMANFSLNVIGAPLVQFSGLLALTALIVVVTAGPQHLSRTTALQSAIKRRSRSWQV
jgi:hypothetical protein